MIKEQEQVTKVFRVTDYTLTTRKRKWGEGLDYNPFTVLFLCISED